MAERRYKVLWVDDEIDLLRSHVIFLSERGYEVVPISNGEDAVALLRREAFDLVLLDEMMTGRDGLSTLEEIREVNPYIPVVMVTKVEAEELMEEAFSRQVDDFLTKPVNPSQVLSACKRLLEGRQIRKDRLGKEYVEEARRTEALLSGPMGWRDWIDLHVRLSEWDLEVAGSQDQGLRQMHRDQRRSCNVAFGKYIETNYPRWLMEEDPPPLSVDVVSEFLSPHLLSGGSVFFIVVDCLRLDHWLAIEPLVGEYFSVERKYYYSILPTATPYARNAIFSGLFPAELARRYPDIWHKGEDDEHSRNRYEEVLLEAQLKAMGIKLRRGLRYFKVVDIRSGEEVLRRLGTLRHFPLVAVVVNFLDILAHGRMESGILREITPDEDAFRSLVVSWFRHSTLFALLRNLSRMGITVVLTTDHGSILATRSALVHGDRHTSTSLRYKYGNSLKADPRQTVIVRDPETYGLPRITPATNFLLAKEDYYFVYPTQFHEYQRLYRDSFQHGGISLEEMVLPVVTLKPK
ncbi:MAG: PglZ domain-containing protein [Candidatus Latescibacterota bacterium]|nr:MAG: PglZ domain-containing protein [Candidatus Latescibacterota bacterium]